MTDKLKTASAHNKDLTGRVEMEESKLFVTRTVGELGEHDLAFDQKRKTLHNIDDLNEIRQLRSSLSRAQERLKKIRDIAFSEIRCETDEMCDYCAILTTIHRLATEDAKPSPEREEKP